MYVERIDGHVGDRYSTWNSSTHKFSEIRDVLCLNRVFYRKKIEDYKLESYEDETF